MEKEDLTKLYATARVTIEDVKANMQDVYVTTIKPFGKPITIVAVKMQNGFTIVD